MFAAIRRWLQERNAPEVSRIEASAEIQKGLERQVHSQLRDLIIYMDCLTTRRGVERLQRPKGEEQ